MSRTLYNTCLGKFLAVLVLAAFLSNTLSIPSVYAQNILIPGLPKPGTMVNSGSLFNPVVLRGLKVSPQDPFRLEFLVDMADSTLSKEEVRGESDKMVKYFLACLTIPDDDLWVNLSPYESGRMIPPKLGATELGRDLLAQDYLLKQLTASMLHPDGGLGKKFWDRVYSKLHRLYGTTEIPVGTFNKVWIMPESATVYENGDQAFVVNGHLKVMLEEDYLALKQGADTAADLSARAKESRAVSLAAVRDVILPEIEREVNEGKNFTQLRQIFYAMVLAEWFKYRLKNRLLSQIYVGKNKTAGVESDDKTIKDKIYQQYLESFKVGVFNFIREDKDVLTQEVVPRKYFSGGFKKPADFTPGEGGRINLTTDPGNMPDGGDHDSARVVVDLAPLADESPTGPGEVSQSSAAVAVPSLISGEDQEFLRVLVSEGSQRALFWTDDVDGFEQSLRAETLAKGKRYLRLTLRDEQDLNRLLTTIVVSGEGKIQRRAGPLEEILTQGGVLLIDYIHSDPKTLLALNSLFDKEPYFRSLAVSRGLTIAGVLREDQTLKQDASFYSRYHSVSAWKYSSEDMISRIKPLGPDEPFDGIVADLWGMKSSVNNGEQQSLSRYRKMRAVLIGGPVFGSEDGRIHIEQGALIRALAEGKDLLLRGADWADEGLRTFLRQILSQEEIEFNGEKYPIPPDFVTRIFSQERNWSQGVQNKTLISTEEAQPGEETWVINPETENILFTVLAIHNEHHVQRPGLLDRPKLRLLITQNLDDIDGSIWHQIMHAPGEIEIQLAPGVNVPQAYEGFRSEKLKSNSFRRAVSSWEEVRGQKSFVLEGDYLDFLEARVRTEFAGSDIELIPVTSDTQRRQIVDDMNVVSEDDDGLFVIQPQERPLVQALRAGKVVVLKGLQTNAALARQLDSALGESPYLVVNGERLNLADLPGRLVVLKQPTLTADNSARYVAEITPSDQELGQILANEFQDKFDPQDFARVMELRDLLVRNIPLPSRQGQYNPEVNFQISRLRLLFSSLNPGRDNWLEAIDRVISPAYALDPDVSAYVRVMARVVFGQEEPGQTPRTVHGEKLRDVLNQVAPGDWRQSWSQRFWLLADTLTTDLLQDLNLARNFRSSAADQEKVFAILQRAIVKKHQGEGEREDFERFRFGIEGDVSDAADIDTTLSRPGMTWQEKAQNIIQAFNHTRGVMAIGPPGVGKSFITEEIAREMQYAPGEIIGPVTVGSDTHEPDMVAKVATDNGKTTVREGPVARWARLPQGGLLVVDESNLPRQQDFWDFLETAFGPEPYVWVNGEKVKLTPRHRIIFTGNQETMEGRRFMDLIEGKMIKVLFNKFPREFIAVKVADYLSSNMTRRPQLVALITDLQFFFQKMNPEVDFTLRDVQEVSARVNAFVGNRWSQEQVVSLAWNLYKGYFTDEEKQALTHLIAARYGVDVIKQEETRMKDFASTRVESYFNQSGITMAESTAILGADVADLMRMRAERIAGRSIIQGKRGMIVQGPSGRGKDVTVIQELYEQGLRESVIPGARPRPELDDESRRVIEAMEANAQRMGRGHEKATAETPAVNKFYRLNGALDTDYIAQVLEKARSEGSVVVISEANLLPSEFLEGRLNDVLTGNAHPGFTLFFTINGVDFGAREKFSSALLNRVIFEQIEDYASAELSHLGWDWLAQFPALKNFRADDLKVIVNAHLWLRDTIKENRHRPTTREFMRAVELAATLSPKEGSPEAKAEAVQQALDLVYGPLYLRHFANQPRFPGREELLNYQKDASEEKKRVFIMFTRLVNQLVPQTLGEVKVNENPYVQNVGAYWSSAGKTITLASTTLVKGLSAALNVIYHESSHARRTRDSALTLKLESQAKELVDDLEDLRHEADFAQEYPFSGLGQASAETFMGMVQNMDVDQFLSWQENPQRPLTSAQMFRQTLLAYAHKGMTPDSEKAARRKQLEEFADLIDEVVGINPVRLALNHLDTAREIGEMTAANPDEDEVQFAQYRALTRMEKMVEDYLRLPPEEEPAESQMSDADVSTRLNGTAEALRQAGESRPHVARGTSAKVSAAAMTPGMIAQKKAELLAKKRDTALLLERRAESHLRVLEDDLAKPDDLLDERLEEIVSLLADPSYPKSLAPQLGELGKVLPESPVLQRAQEAGTKARAILDGRVKERLRFQNMTREGLLEELALMKKDLAQLDSLSYGRLKEMERQLEDGNDPFSLVKKISEFRSPEIDLQVNLLIEAIKRYLSLFGESPDVDGEIRSDLTGPRYSRMVQEGEGRPGKGRQYQRRDLAHNPEAARNYGKVVDILPPTPGRDTRIVLNKQETVRRNPRLAGISLESGRSELLKAVAVFLAQRATPDKVFGQEGELDLEQYLSDPAAGFLKSGGVPETKKREVVLTGDLGKTRWNPVLEELFHFLFENGFQVTVYTSPTTFVDGIVTVGDLKRVTAQAAQVEGEAIQEDLNKRRQKTEYEMISLPDIQRRVQEVYAYRTVQSVLLGTAQAGPDSAVAAPAAQPAPSIPSAEVEQEVEQMVGELKEFLSARGLIESGSVELKTKKARDGMTGIELSIFGSKSLNESDMKDLIRRFGKHIIVIFISAISSDVMEGLLTMGRLEFFAGYNMTNDSIESWPVWRRHPNKEMLIYQSSLESFYTVSRNPGIFDAYPSFWEAIQNGSSPWTVLSETPEFAAQPAPPGQPEKKAEEVFRELAAFQSRHNLSAVEFGWSGNRIWMSFMGSAVQKGLIKDMLQIAAGHIDNLVVNNLDDIDEEDILNLRHLETLSFLGGQLGDQSKKISAIIAMHPNRDEGLVVSVLDNSSDWKDTYTWQRDLQLTPSNREAINNGSKNWTVVSEHPELYSHVSEGSSPAKKTKNEVLQGWVDFRTAHNLSIHDVWAELRNNKIDLTITIADRPDKEELIREILRIGDDQITSIVVDVLDEFYVEQLLKLKNLKRVVAWVKESSLDDQVRIGFFIARHPNRKNFLVKHLDSYGAVDRFFSWRPDVTKIIDDEDDQKLFLNEVRNGKKIWTIVSALPDIFYDQVSYPPDTESEITQDEIFDFHDNMIVKMVVESEAFDGAQGVGLYLESSQGVEIELDSINSLVGIGGQHIVHISMPEFSEALVPALLKMPRLQSVEADSSADNVGLSALWRDHPNREALIVNLKQGGAYSWDRTGGSESFNRNGFLLHKDANGEPTWTAVSETPEFAAQPAPQVLDAEPKKTREEVWEELRILKEQYGKRAEDIVFHFGDPDSIRMSLDGESIDEEFITAVVRIGADYIKEVEVTSSKAFFETELVTLKNLENVVIIMTTEQLVKKSPIISSFIASHPNRDKLVVFLSTIDADGNPTLKSLYTWEKDRNLATDIWGAEFLAQVDEGIADWNIASEILAQQPSPAQPVTTVEEVREQLQALRAKYGLSMRETKDPASVSDGSILLDLDIDTRQDEKERILNEIVQIGAEFIEEVAIMYLDDSYVEALSKLKKLKKVFLHGPWQSSLIQPFIATHPNRENLIVLNLGPYDTTNLFVYSWGPDLGPQSYYTDQVGQGTRTWIMVGLNPEFATLQPQVPDTEAEKTAEEVGQPSAGLSKTPKTADEKFAEQVIKSLIDPETVLANLARRFEREGLKDQFDALLSRLGIDKAKIENVLKAASIVSAQASPSEAAPSGVASAPAPVESTQGKDKYGGIDLNPGVMKLEINSDGTPVLDGTPLTPAMLEQMNFQGFTPVLIDIQPLPNFLIFLGLNESPVKKFSQL